MGATITTICNLALSKIGARKIIEIDEESNEARTCKMFYTETRDDVLRSHRWNFAISRVTLSEVISEPAFGWRNGFQLPVDCLRVFECNGWDLIKREGNWEVEARILLCNEDDADIRYIRRVEDANLFDSSFIEAISTKLASQITMPINGSGDMQSALLKQYVGLTASSARRLDAVESRPLRRPAWQNSDLVMSRFKGA